MRFVIVTGMSGAGKSTVLKMLEDMGFFCVDNLPVMLIEKFAEIAHDDKLEVDNVAIGVDIRSGQALGEMSVCLETLKKRNFTYEILFLDANEPVLVKRYKERIRCPSMAGSTKASSRNARRSSFCASVRIILSIRAICLQES